MKKLFIVLSSELPKGFKTIGGSGGMNTLLGKTPQWNFDLNPIFQGWFVNHRTARGDNGDFQVYECLHETTKTGYGIFGGIVLDERFAEVMKTLTEQKPFARIYIEYIGKPTGKKYKNFAFAVDEEAVFNYADFPGFTGKPVMAPKEENPRAKEENQANRTANIPTGFKPTVGQQTQATSSKEEFSDDLPF